MNGFLNMSIEISTNPKRQKHFTLSARASAMRKKRISKGYVPRIVGDGVETGTWNEEMLRFKHLWNANPIGFPRDSLGRFVKRTSEDVK